MGKSGIHRRHAVDSSVDVFVGRAWIHVPNIFGFPVIASPTSLSQLVLIDASDILAATGNIVEVSTAEHASFVATTTPGSSPVAADLVSAYQYNYVLIRVIREVSWLLAHPTSVVRMSLVY